MSFTLCDIENRTSARMVVRHHVEGYENFLKFMEDFKENGLVIVLYSGTKLPSGESWCSDCVEGKNSSTERNN